MKIIGVDESINDNEIIPLTAGTVRTLSSQIKSLQKQVNDLVDEKIDLHDEINELKRSTEYQHFLDGMKNKELENQSTFSILLDFLDNLMGLFGYTKQASYGYDSWAGQFWDYDIIDKNGNRVWSSNDVAMSGKNELIVWSEIVCKILRNEGLDNEIKLLGIDLRNYLRVNNNG